MEALLKAPEARQDFSLSLPVLNTSFFSAHHDQVYISSNGQPSKARHFQLRYSTFLGLCAQPDIASKIAQRAQAEGLALLTEGQDCRSCVHYDPKLKKGNRGTIPLIIGKPGVVVSGCLYSPKGNITQTRPVPINGQDYRGSPNVVSIDLETSCAYAHIQAEVLLSDDRLLDPHKTSSPRRHLSARTYFGFDRKPTVLQRLRNLLPI